MGLFDKVKGASGSVTQGLQKGLQGQQVAMQEKREAKQISKQEQDRKAELDKQQQKELSLVFRASRTMGDISIDTDHGLFKVKRATTKVPKQSGALMKTGKALAAVYTLGASVAVEYAMKPDDRVFTFAEIRSYELLQDDSQITSGGVGMAIVGGAVFGGAGAVAGSVAGKKKTKKVIENMLLRIDLNDFGFPCVIVPYITKSTKVNSNDYKKALGAAQETISCLDLIIKQVDSFSQNEQQHNKNHNESPIEQVKQLKELADIGAITAEEFEAKKKQLLGI